MIRGPLPGGRSHAQSTEYVAPVAGASLLDAGFPGHEVRSGSAWLTGTTPPITD